MIPFVASCSGIDNVVGDNSRFDEAVSCVANTVDCAMACATANFNKCDGDLKAAEKLSVGACESKGELTEKIIINPRCRCHRIVFEMETLDFILLILTDPLLTDHYPTLQQIV